MKKYICIEEYNINDGVSDIRVFTVNKIYTEKLIDEWPNIMPPKLKITCDAGVHVTADTYVRKGYLKEYFKNYFITKENIKDVV